MEELRRHARPVQSSDRRWTRNRAFAALDCRRGRGRLALGLSGACALLARPLEFLRTLSMSRSLRLTGAYATNACEPNVEALGQSMAFMRLISVLFQATLRCLAAG